MEEKRKRGRPRKEDNGKNNYLKVRLSDEELDRINYICDKTGLSKSDAIRESIRIKYNLTRHFDN